MYALARGELFICTATLRFTVLSKLTCKTVRNDWASGEGMTLQPRGFDDHLIGRFFYNYLILNIFKRKILKYSHYLLVSAKIACHWFCLFDQICRTDQPIIRIAGECH